MAGFKQIIEEVTSLAEPLLGESAMELVDVECVFENGRWILRVFIDKEGGVTLDDCGSVSRELGDLIEAENTVNLPYVLEISSPGLNRPLKHEKDFVRSVGKMVRLKMAKAVNNRKNFAGRLVSVEGENIGIVLDDATLVTLPLKNIDAAKLKYEFKN